MTPTKNDRSAARSRAVRCAIYTRKSSAEGLDAQFTSLDNQREYCSAYIASQGAEGWAEMPSRYDDGGFSGGTMRRPALDRVRADIADGLVDMVVVYKIDRLSRSLRDFANLIAEFETQSVSFVSVTQSFSTATAMGRLTLNVLLSFAQFERELTGERLRDWFAGARARGRWTGPRPFGFRTVDGRLAIEESEAAIVRLAHACYARLKSTRLVANELNARGHLNKFGRTFSKRTVIEMLSNRLYRGLRSYRGKPIDTPGHDAIVSPAAWDRTQALIASSARRRGAARTPHHGGILKGIIFGPSGHAMMHVPVRGRNGQQYRYYVSTLIGRYGPGACPAGRFRAAEIEDAVIAAMGRLTGETDPKAAATARIAVETGPARDGRVQAELTGMVRRLVMRIDIREDAISVTLITGAVLALPLAGRIADTKRTLGWWQSPEIAEMIFSGRPDAEIARDLGVAYGTVSRIRTNLRQAEAVTIRDQEQLART